MSWPETNSHSWTTSLPDVTGSYTKCSPTFYLYNVEAHLLINVDIRGRYCIQVCSSNLPTLSCNFNLVVFLGGLHHKIFSSSCRLHTTDITVSLLKFDTDDLTHIPNRKRCRPLLITIIWFDTSYKKRKVDQCVQTPSYMDPYLRPGDLADDFEKLFHSQRDSDVTVKCEGEVIKVHSFVFGSRSEVFKAMLQNDGEIVIRDMSVTAFKYLVHFLYTDKLPELDYEKAKYFYEIGDMYGLRGLMRRCAEFLIDNLASFNACECLAMADAHSDQYLKSNATNFILIHAIYLFDDVWVPFCQAFPELAFSILNKSH